jgi:hypothetical protein
MDTPGLAVCGLEVLPHSGTVLALGSAPMVDAHTSQPGVVMGFAPPPLAPGAVAGRRGQWMPCGSLAGPGNGVLSVVRALGREAGDVFVLCENATLPGQGPQASRGPHKS